MKLAPYRLVTLLEILETSAEAWWRLSSLLGQSLIRMESSVIPDTGVLGATMGELQREAVRLNLQSAADQLERIDEHVSGDNVTNQTMRPLFVDLHYRVI